MTEFVYGRHAVYHLIAAGRRKVIRLHLEKEIEKILEVARSKKIPVSLQDPNFFTKRLGPQATAQGVAAETEGYPYVSHESLAGESVLLVLDEVQDPQNLGALCRSAYLLGVGGVIIPETHSASIGAGACHAAVGAVEYLRISRVSSIAKCLDFLKKDGYWIYGADQESSKVLFEERFPPKVVLVVGGEERGLRRLVKEKCDILLKIPSVTDQVDSLNASVAGGVFLYEILRQKSENS